MPRIIRVIRATRRLVVVGLREGMVLESSRTKRRWIAGIFEARVNSWIGSGFVFEFGFGLKRGE